MVVLSGFGSSLVLGFPSSMKRDASSSYDSDDHVQNKNKKSRGGITNTTAPLSYDDTCDYDKSDSMGGSDDAMVRWVALSDALVHRSWIRWFAQSWAGISNRHAQLTVKDELMFDKNFMLDFIDELEKTEPPPFPNGQGFHQNKFWDVAMALAFARSPLIHDHTVLRALMERDYNCAYFASRQMIESCRSTAAWALIDMLEEKYLWLNGGEPERFTVTTQTFALLDDIIEQSHEGRDRGLPKNCIDGGSELICQAAVENWMRYALKHAVGKEKVLLAAWMAGTAILVGPSGTFRMTRGAALRSACISFSWTTRRTKSWRQLL